MSLPELRCLLCERVLLDETTALPAERCQRCGKLMQLETPAAIHPLPPGEQAGFTPGEGSLLTAPFDELPEAVPVVQPRSAPPVLRPASSDAGIPLVQPRTEPPAGRPATPKSLWVPPIQSHPPVPPHEDDIERPKPKFGCAILVVIGCMLLSLMAVTFIVYAIVRGLRKTPKTDATPTKLVTEVAPAKSTPDKPKSRDPELIPVPATTLWIPPRGTFPLGPATAASTAEATLPGACTHGVLAGNGRFILFPTPSAQMIAVFDVSMAKVIGYLPMSDRDSLVAGTANHAVVLSPAGQSIGRFDLTTLKLERTELFGNRFGKPHALAAGHAAGGPIYLLASKKSEPKLHLLNPDTLLAIDWKPDTGPFKKPNGIFTGALAADRAYLRASANGRVLIGGAATGKQNYRADRFELLGTEPVIAPTTISIGNPAFPTADGGWTAFDANPKSTRFPMAEGCGYFEIVDKGGSKVLAMTFVGEGHVQRAEVKGIADFAADEGPDQDRRAFLIPSAQAFVYLGTDAKTIHWRRVKISEELSKVSQQDYLVVSSAPPATATRGRTFRYEPRILGNSNDAAIRLDVAPPGMKAEGKGIVWDVPETGPDADVPIELALESKLKPNVAAKQRFTLSVVSTPPTGTSLIAPKGMEPQPLRDEKAGSPDAPLQFTGEPLRMAKRGQTYRTTLGLTTPEAAAVQILSAPPGAKWVGSDLVWEVPADYPFEPVPIVVMAQGVSGQRAVLGYLLEIQE